MLESVLASVLEGVLEGVLVGVLVGVLGLSDSNRKTIRHGDWFRWTKKRGKLDDDASLSDMTDMILKRN